MVRLILLCVAVPMTALLAENLPLKRFGLSEGLPSETITCIVPDSQGYLWLCAGGKLTRFDGSGFKAFDWADGMPDEPVSDIVEFDESLLLLATRNGLVQFRPEAQQSFQLMPLEGSDSPPGIQYFYRDRLRNVWAAAPRDLWRIYRDAYGRIQSEHVILPTRGNDFERSVTGVLVDEAGKLWIATGGGWIHWRNHSGDWDGQKLMDYCCQRMVDGGPSRAIIISERGFFEINLAGGRQGKLDAHQISGQESQGAAFAGSNGSVWADAGRALMLISGAPDHRSVSLFGPQHGLPKLELRSIAEYPSGTLWLGYARGGLWRYSRTGFYRYSTEDGLLEAQLKSFRLQPNGRFAVVTHGSRQQLALHLWNGTQFEGVRPWTAPKTRWSWGWNETAFEDSRGQWWVPTANGLLRYPKVSRLKDLHGVRPDLHLSTSSGLYSDEIFRIYEDRHGDVWIFCAHAESQKTGWCVWRREKQKVERMTQIPFAGWAKAILEDRHGFMWLGMDTALIRFRADRGSTVYPHQEPTVGPPTSLFEDNLGRIWMGSQSGLLRVDNPSAESPGFLRYTRTTGLPYDVVDRVVQDHAGNYYISGQRGVHRFDPATGKTFPVATSDAIPANVSNGVIDGEGNVWFSTDNQLLRYTPFSLASLPLPRARLSSVSLAGKKIRIARRGSTDLGDVGESQNGTVAVEYTTPQVLAGAVIYYERKLVGSGLDWSEPTAERYAGYELLRPGRYEFMIRARNGPDQPPGAPATFSFTVPAPFYLSWWFVALSTATLAGIVFAFQQTRIQQLREIAALRERIAQDLHDDVGTSLTKIAVLSEVARARSTNEDQLAEIARVARAVIDSLGYAVWAISPANDSLKGLIRGTRKLTVDLFGNGNVAATVSGPNEDVALPQDLRRQVFSMVNETLNNAARHSGCSEVNVTFAIENAILRVEVRDDGRGFSPAHVEAGNGLRGLRRRCQVLGGTVEIASSPGKGTHVRVTLPVRRKRAPGSGSRHLFR